MTSKWMESVGCGFAKEKCCYCDKRDGVIWYSFDHRKHRIRDGKKEQFFDGYKPFCEFCCEHLALGMLRDCAELVFGRKRADQDYQAMLNRKSDAKPTHPTYDPR